MDDLGKILAQSVLARIKEIEDESNLDFIINTSENDIREEALLIKEHMASLKAVLESI
ncbi:MAG TPA: hypothetical protein VFD02_02425 [Syntrophomonadaceae bacterium]|nr:hypothetical protein [Syntrophomonadaceae bacterium]